MIDWKKGDKIVCINNNDVYIVERIFYMNLEEYVMYIDNRNYLDSHKCSFFITLKKFINNNRKQKLNQLKII